MNPGEEILWVFVDGSDEGGCFRTLPFSIEVFKSGKNLNRDVPLTGLDVVEDDRFGQRSPVQIGGHDLQVSNQRSEVTVIGLSEGIHRSVLKFYAFFTQNASSDSSQGFVVGSDEVDLEQEFGKTVSGRAPG